MPNRLKNWTYKDVALFLEQHFFSLVNIDGSHHFFKGFVDGKERLTFITKHGSKAILPRTLECTIHKTGIPKKIWEKWANAGGKESVQYEGAEQK